MTTRASRDYYAVLGVRRDADRAAIKKAFRTRASELHPDVCDEPDAEERFRELAEAYEVLSRPESRARYDRFGSVTRGVSGFASGRSEGSPDSSAWRRRHHWLFDDLIDAAAPATRPGQQGADVTVDVVLEFLEAKRGLTRGVRYTALGECRACRGEGTPSGNGRRVCPACAGSGRVRDIDSAAGSRRLVQYRACGLCGATGRLVTDPCPDCNGRGRLEEERTVLVSIPAGAADGAQIRFEGQGSAGGPGGGAGDVLVRVRVAPPPDSPLLRHLAAAGAVLAAILLVVTLLVLD